jgi:hypothetical protein
MLAKCARHGDTYGVRIEQRDDDWVSTWAFKIDDNRAKREGFDKTKIEGSFAPSGKFPGCPYCKADSFMQCVCGKLLCYDEERTADNNGGDSLKCAWCGAKIAEIESVDTLSVKSGGY